ncbi:MAG: helix-turn-helix domain-containing protein [Deltaproteobacteria bacterium]|nr:helix-turn-helix domain-containing protein [Deltaproteobacteria bacterium]
MAQVSPAEALTGAQDAAGEAGGDGAATTLPQALTVDEAARLLRVNRKTLYDAVRDGRIPGVIRMGRSIRIGRDALLGWLRGNGGPALGDDR